MSDDHSPGLKSPRSGDEPQLGGDRRARPEPEPRGGRLSLTFVRPLLNHAGPGMRLRGISLLARVDDSEALDLLEGFSSHRDPALRRAAAWALAEQAARVSSPGRRERVAGLLGGLAASPDPLIRREVAEGLGHCGGPDQIAGLERLLEDGTDYVRSASARALGRIACRLEDHWAADSAGYRLAGVLGNDFDGLTRMAAAHALIDLGPRLRDAAVQAEVTAALIRGLADRYGAIFGFGGERVCHVCADALRVLGSEAAREALRRYEEQNAGD